MLESCKTPCDLILLTTYMQIGWLYGSVTEQKISLTWMEIFITVCQSVQLLKDLLPLRSALGSVEIFLELALTSKSRRKQQTMELSLSFTSSNGRLC